MNLNTVNDFFNTLLARKYVKTGKKQLIAMKKMMLIPRIGLITKGW